MNDEAGPGPFWKRVLWMLVIWALSVTALGIVASLIRWWLK